MARKKGPARARLAGDGGANQAPPGSSAPDDSRDDGGDAAGHRPRAVPRADRLIAAFEAGRLLNRLGFHLQQAWFGEPDHRDRAEAALGDLGRAVRPLAPPDQRRQLQDAVTGEPARLMSRLFSGDHSEFLMGLNEELNSDDEVGILEYRGGAARRVSEAVGAARQPIEPYLDDPAGLALELGLRLDQGLCRPDIHRFLDDAREPAGDVKASGLAGKLTPEMIERSSSPPRPYRNYIAITPRGPGEVPPDDNWAADIVKLLGELDLSGVVAPEDLHAVQDRGPAEMTGLIDRLDAGIRAAVTPQKSPGEPGAETPPRERRRPNGEWDEVTEARAKLAYEKCCNTSKTYKESLAEFRTVVEERGWKRVKTINGIIHIAGNYAKRYSLPPPPARQDT